MVQLLLANLLFYFFHTYKIVDVTIPEIEVMRLAHYITIGSECSTALDPYKEKYVIL